jgi:hypothetical protein
MRTEAFTPSAEAQNGPETVIRVLMHRAIRPITTRKG